jgi:hypothetical protein
MLCCVIRQGTQFPVPFEWGYGQQIWNRGPKAGPAADDWAVVDELRVPSTPGAYVLRCGSSTFCVTPCSGLKSVFILTRLQGGLQAVAWTITANHGTFPCMSRAILTGLRG